MNVETDIKATEPVPTHAFDEALAELEADRKILVQTFDIDEDGVPVQDVNKDEVEVSPTLH